MATLDNLSPTFLMGFLGWGKSEAYDYIGILKESHRGLGHFVDSYRSHPFCWGKGCLFVTQPTKVSFKTSRGSTSQ